MVAITFDGHAKTVTIGYDGALTEVSAAEMYSRWKEWVVAGNAQYLPAFAESVGGNELGAGVSLSGYYFIRNDLGWRIVPANGFDHTLQISGDLYPQDASTAFVSSPVGDYTVLVTFQRSAASYVVVGSGGGGSVDNNAIAAAVWNRSMDAHTTIGTFGDRMRKLISRR